jgi:23S rRNA-/tRNA-specific pseudouridylate synthase
LTGRTNQIRLHFFAYDHPLVGDRLYSQKKYTAQKSTIKLNRIFLHAARLEFIDPSGETRIFESPLPLELKKIIDEL